MRQRTKLAVVLVVVAVVVGSAVVGAAELFRRDTQAQAEESLQQTANVVANQTGNALEEEVVTIQRFGTRPAAAEFGTVGSLLGSFTNNTDFEVAVVIDRNRTIVAIRGNDISREQRAAIVGTEAPGAYLGPVLTEGKVRVSDPERANGTYFVEVAAPVFDGNRVVGAVAGRLDVPLFVRPATTLDADRGTSVAVALQNGSGWTTVKSAERFEQSLSASASGRQYGTRWTVTVRRDRGPLADRLQELTVLQTGSLLVVFLAVLGLGYWEYTNTLRQTERLLDAFEELRDGNYDHTLSLSSATEWERISAGFNELTRGLARRERAIREREQQLEVLNRVLRHNLRNDMNVIIGHAEMLPRMTDDDRVEDAAETIVRLGEELVGHGQKARQLEAAMDDRETVDLDACEVVSAAVGQAPTDGATVETDLPPAAPVRASESLEVAVANLVENAVEHSDREQPWVRVAVETDEEAVTITVADDGPGIPDHEREVLSAGIETALKHGSGVGLWLVQFVVDRSGGSLSFSDREPRGSIVSIRIPNSEDSAGAGAVAGGRTPGEDQSAGSGLAGLDFVSGPDDVDAGSGGDQ